LEAGGAVLFIEQMECGETDVAHLLFVKNEAVLGPVVVRLRDIGGGQRRCGCAPTSESPSAVAAAALVVLFSSATCFIRAMVVSLNTLLDSS
jgi:hypothetical protein